MWLVRGGRGGLDSEEADAEPADTDGELGGPW